MKKKSLYLTLGRKNPITFFSHATLLLIYKIIEFETKLFSTKNNSQSVTMQRLHLESSIARF